MELVLIRHARPERIEAADGPVDPSLTARGRVQARALAEWLAADPGGAITAVYSSTLRRAVETAEPLAARLGLDVVTDDRLCEWDRHHHQYIPMEDLGGEALEQGRAMREGRFADLGIDIDAFRAATLAGIADIAGRHPGETVAVVCHGGVLNVYLADILGLAVPAFFVPDYTCMCRVRVATRGGLRSVVTLNETPHLRNLVDDDLG